MTQPRQLRPFHHFPDPQHFHDLERLEDDITELAAHIHAATFQLLELVAVYDEQQGWAQHGLNSCAHWLQWKCGTNLGAAREKVRVATRKNEDFLLGVARHGTAAHVETVVRNYRLHQRREALEIENERYAGRELGWFTDADGRFRGNAAALYVTHSRSGLGITSRTMRPNWDGEHMDADLAQLAMQTRE